MRFKLADGTIVEAVKDCGCVDHDGPHWLYMDDLWKASNQKLRDAGNVRGFIVAELHRLKEKRFSMERQRIDEIIR